ncbi:hypothetical protein EVAR_86372_1 [Eumeta japonica]|uniref:Uncharacterized protein n=1 Tax=Eumeta variegata TaxID=151549 RepID=A0A4C1WBD5_EUMVA|nr:hypothetical protein EVAR_86372_1 [Eumeta japonica]
MQIILHDHLSLRKRSSRWVPHKLTDEQKVGYESVGHRIRILYCVTSFGSPVVKCQAFEAESTGFDPNTRRIDFYVHYSSHHITHAPCIGEYVKPCRGRCRRISDIGRWKAPTRTGPAWGA